MSTEITKVDPKEFGLDEVQVVTIEQAFAPKIAERDGLAVIYQQVITMELTDETCQKAGELRRKLVKVRTGIAEIHKTQKAFFLAAGRFVDAWKNKETLPVEQMEENLEKIEKHFILIEQERITKLELTRAEQLRQYTEIMPMSLGLMQEDVFQAYLAAQKTAYEAKIAAENQAELDRIAAEKADAAERERIRLENEALKQAAIEREKAIEAERKAAEEKARIEREKQDAILASERAEAAAKQKAIEDAARIEREKAEAERAKLAAELKAKEDAEAKAKADADRIEKGRIAAEAKAAKAPDKDKLKAFVTSIILPVLPELKSDESKAAAAVITAKFEAFKTWANQQIETI